MNIDAKKAFLDALIDLSADFQRDYIKAAGPPEQIAVKARWAEFSEFADKAAALRDPNLLVPVLEDDGTLSNRWFYFEHNRWRACCSFDRSTNSLTWLFAIHKDLYKAKVSIVTLLDAIFRSK